MGKIPIYTIDSKAKHHGKSFGKYQQVYHVEVADIYKIGQNWYYQKIFC